MTLLSSIHSPADLKKLDKQQLPALCAEIRDFLIEHIMQSGGHLASNLGVVELTVALHRVFDLPKDKLIFDVGHQSYVHKILTGRLEQFDTLRQLGGLSGFPKTSESPYDAFNTGHSSTSLSAALGIARARDLNGEDFDVVALIGDGALTGGMAFEAMNDAGDSGTHLIMVLNDNEMSIERNVGGLSTYLSKLRSAPNYTKFKKAITRVLTHSGRAGKRLEKGLRKIKDTIKFAYMSGALFEYLGWTYLGIIDGHDIGALTDVLERARHMDGPVIIHTFTTKGLGYADAEEYPNKFHGVSRKTKTIKRDDMDYSTAFGSLLCYEAKRNKKIAAITAAMAAGCGLTEFSQQFPERFFDVGIAEQHAVTMAAGLAIQGLTPVVCIYSTFLQRAYDQILHDVCLQNLHVIFGIDRAGLVGEDGETHQGVFDLSFLSHIPNIIILAPSCYEELKGMLSYAIHNCTGPVAIRYPRGAIPFRETAPFTVGRAEVLCSGDHLTLAAEGRMVDTAVEVGRLLAEQDICAEIINLRTVKPFDMATLQNSVAKTGWLVTIEDNVKLGGMGQMLRCGLSGHFQFTPFGFEDQFIPQGKPAELFAQYRLDAKSIAEQITKEYKK